MTESHLRRLAVIMIALEAGIGEIESALVSEPSDPILAAVENDIRPESHPQIRALIAQLREEIRAVKQAYSLASALVSARRRFSTKLSLLSIDLTEATSPHMLAYGQILEAERGLLDEQMVKMRAMVDELNALISR
jgi:hypothetical protein